jgi:hypothetical protein
LTADWVFKYRSRKANLCNIKRETWNGKKTHSPEIKAGRKEYELQPRNLSKIRNADGLKGTNC